VISAYVTSHYTLDYITLRPLFKTSFSSWPLAVKFDSFHIGLLPQCLNWPFWEFFFCKFCSLLKCIVAV